MIINLFFFLIYSLIYIFITENNLFSIFSFLLKQMLCSASPRACKGTTDTSVCVAASEGSMLNTSAPRDITKS